MDELTHTHTHTQQKAKQGSALKVTKETDNPDNNIRLNTAACIHVQLNRFIRPGCVRSVEFSSVVKTAPQAQMESEEGREGQGAREREGVRKWE